MECIQDLRDSFEERGSTLIVRNGDPEEELSNLIERLYSQFIQPLSFTPNNSATKQVSEVSELNGPSELEIQVFVGKDDFEEEKRVEERMEKKMKEKMEELKRKENSCLKKQVSLSFQLVGNDSTLFDTRDMPFPVHKNSKIPLTFTSFRNQIEKKNVKVRKCSPPPSTFSSIKSPSTFSSLLLFIKKIEGEIPSLKQLFSPNSSHSNPSVESVFSYMRDSSIYLEEERRKEVERRSAFPFRGGEKSALERLNSFVWENQNVKTYKERRNEMIGSEYSSKFSPFLAFGCLSPRKIFWEIEEFEKKVEKNESTYWLFFELLWRDFFRVYSISHGNRIFSERGPSRMRREEMEWKIDSPLHLHFKCWANATTGFPLIDACMTELNKTGTNIFFFTLLTLLTLLTFFIFFFFFLLTLITSITHLPLFLLLPFISITSFLFIFIFLISSKKDLCQIVGDK